MKSTVFFQRAKISFKLQPTEINAKISSKPGGFDARAKALKTEESASARCTPRRN